MFNFYQLGFSIDVISSFLFVLKVARAILENPNDTTKVHLIYANVSLEDILLKVNTSLLFLS